MTSRDRDGSAESIRHRLRNVLRARGEDVSLGLQRYAAERFLYRLGRSVHRERFVLKGATLFAILGTTYRPTRDLDFTAYGDANLDSVLSALREICNTPDNVDALTFEADAITTKPIRDGSEYPGIRVHIVALLGNSRIPIQLDLGFGNAIVPGPEEVEYRSLLGDAPPEFLPTRRSPWSPRSCTRWSRLDSRTAVTKTSTISTRWRPHFALNAVR